MLAIIDGDVLCYQACEARWKKKCEIEKRNLNIIKLDKEGWKIPPSFSPEEDKIYMKESWQKFQDDLDSLLGAIFATDYVMAVKGGQEENFRKLLYPEYKLNRHANPYKQNLFVPALRELAIMEEFAIPAIGREADDLIRIWAEEARACNQEYVICTIDKDMKCIPGLHYQMHLNLKESERLIRVTEEEAIRHYYEQLLKGDPTDHIPGVPRLGEIKATKILAPFKTEEEFQEQVVDQYIQAYGDNWLEYLMSNGRMIHLQKHPDDYFDCHQWEVVKELI